MAKKAIEALMKLSTTKGAAYDRALGHWSIHNIEYGFQLLDEIKRLAKIVEAALAWKSKLIDGGGTQLQYLEAHQAYDDFMKILAHDSEVEPWADYAHKSSCPAFSDFRALCECKP